MWRRVARGLMFSSILAAMVPAAFAQQDFFGTIETPADTERVSGMVLVRGFVLDQQAISRADLYVDDQFQHSADINVPRIDVIEAYPDWEGLHQLKPGFQTSFLASRFSNGFHTIHVKVLTSDNKSFEVGRRSVFIDNSINQPPFGSIDIPDSSSIFDANGSFPVVGWVTDVDGIARVDVQIDNLNQQGAVYGDARPDVGNAFPDLPAALFSGFVAHVDTTRIQDGVHTLVVRATDRLGLSRVIGRRNIQIFNSTNNLRPFGSLDEPLRDAVLYGTCGGSVPPNISPIPVSPENHITPVRGWVLDLGTREDLGRVSYVELMIDGVRWFSTDNCRYDPAFGAYIDCYGLPRFDVSRYYPTYPDAPRAGFLFAMDIGNLMNIGLRPGRHVLKLRVGDQEQTFADIPNTSGIPVFFTCVEDRDDFASQGYIDYPNSMEYLKGTVRFRGWAADDNGGVTSVEIIVDGNRMGTAAYGFERPDVRDAYPTLRNNLRSGWQFDLDTTKLSDARHRVTVEVTDREGHKSIIGSADFYVDNP